MCYFLMKFNCKKNYKDYGLLVSENENDDTFYCNKYDKVEIQIRLSLKNIFKELK